MCVKDTGTVANRVRSVLGALGHHPHNRNRHQPSSEPGCGHHLQQGPRMGRPRKPPIGLLYFIFSFPFSSSQLTIINSANAYGCLFFSFLLLPHATVDLLGGTIHWGRTSSFIPPGGHQSHSLQVQVMMSGAGR